MKVSSRNRTKASSKAEVRGTSGACLNLTGARTTRLFHFSKSRLEIYNSRLFLSARLGVEGAVVRLLQLGLEVYWWRTWICWWICYRAWHHLKRRCDLKIGARCDCHLFKWGFKDRCVVGLLERVWISLFHVT